MKLSARRVLWMLCGWLLLGTSIAAQPEYLVFVNSGEDLQRSLNEVSKDGWTLKTANTWTDKCPGGKPTCLIVILEREVRPPKAH